VNSAGRRELAGPVRTDLQIAALNPSVLAQSGAQRISESREQRLDHVGADRDREHPSRQPWHAPNLGHRSTRQAG
jgi:hypothetical protein